MEILSNFKAVLVESATQLVVITIRNFFQSVIWLRVHSIWFVQSAAALLAHIPGRATGSSADTWTSNPSKSLELV